MWTRFSSGSLADEVRSIMNNRRLLQTGIIGTIVTAICCFTPLLVITFGALGLSACIGVIDLVLLPLLGIFILITLYGLWKKFRS